jgi:hypothetical protein
VSGGVRPVVDFIIIQGDQKLSVHVITIQKRSKN